MPHLKAYVLDLRLADHLAGTVGIPPSVWWMGTISPVPSSSRKFASDRVTAVGPPALRISRASHSSNTRALAGSIQSIHAEG